MKVLNAIGSFFKRLFSVHNVKAALVVAERAGITAADVTSGQIPAAIAEALQTVDAAKSITAVEKPAPKSVAPATSPAPASSAPAAK